MKINSALPVIDSLSVAAVSVFEAKILVTVAITAAGQPLGTAQIEIVNGTSKALRVNPAPTNASQVVQQFELVTPHGFNDSLNYFCDQDGYLLALEEWLCEKHFIMT